MATQIQIRRGTTTQWTTSDPVLAEGEIGLDLTRDKIRIGDGTSAWSALSDYSAGGGGGGDLVSTNNLSDVANAGTARSNLGLAIGSDVQAYDADLAALATAGNSTTLAAVTAAFTTALKTKLDGIEALADVTDATNVAAAGAVMQAQTVNAQTGTTYTLVAGDAGKLVTLSNAAGITLTLPQDSDATIAVGTYVDLLQLGAGQVTVAAGTGATLRTSGLTAKARAQYSRLGVQKVSANTWSLYGDLSAS